MGEIKDLTKTLWPNITLMITSLLTAGMAPTTLFVPENYGNGDPWSGKLFEKADMWKILKHFHNFIVNNTIERVIDGHYSKYFRFI